MYGKVIQERTHLPIGSEVQIYSNSWYMSNADRTTGIVNVEPGFTYEMSEYCSKVTKIVEYDEFTHTYELAIDGGRNRWSEEMFKKKENKILFTSVSEEERARLKVDSYPYLL